MKKFLFFSALLCSAMAMNAQESASADFGKAVLYNNGKTLLASPVVKSDIAYSNPVVRVQKAPQAEAIVRTMAPGVYSQILRWTETDKGEGLGAYPADWLYGPALVPWQYYGLSNFTGEQRTFTFTRKDFAEKEEDMVMEDGKLVIFGTTQYYPEVEGSDETGAHAVWSRKDAITLPEGAELMMVSESPIFNTQVDFSAAYYGNLYGYYYGFRDDTYVGDGMNDCRAVVSVFTEPITPLYVYGGSVIVTAADSKKSVTTDNLLFEIYKVTEDGQLGEVVAQAGGGLVRGDAVTGIASIEFSFSEMDGSGLPVFKPVSLPAGEKFAVVVNNVKGSNLRFYFTDDATGGTGNGGGFYLSGDAGTLVPISGNEGHSWADAAIGLKGYIPGGRFMTSPSLTDLNEGFLEVPVGGGYASTFSHDFEELYNEVAVLGSSHTYTLEDGTEQIKLSYPEWITGVEYDDSQYTETGLIYFRFEGAELPQGESGRQGWIEADIYGYKARVLVGQGEFNAVSDAQVAEASARVEGENIVLTYGEGVNTVDVINVAGARVASYALPAGGNFTVPASDYAKGLYILNFKGDKKATVKVVK